MNAIKKEAAVGFAEKNDALVTVTPLADGKGITVELSSSVQKQYGAHIEQLIAATVKELDYTDVHVKVIDKGAWDYTLKARIAAALNRGAEQ